MKLQLRFFLVLASIFIVAAAFLTMQRHFELDRSASVLSSELSQRKKYLQNLVALEGLQEKTFVEDYSFWDDMVTFMKHDDLAFAHENLDTGLSTFKTDADWVYRTDGSLLYFSSADNKKTLLQIDVPNSFFDRLKTHKFEHFYRYVNGNLLEFRAATIVPSDDPDHKSPAQGYLLIGRVLNDSYTKSIANLTGDNISFSGPRDTDDKKTSDVISFGQPFQDWDGTPVATLRASTKVPIISDLQHKYVRQLRLLAVFTILASALIIALIWWVVLKPIRLLNRSIKSKQPELLDTLSRQRTEFGTLALTVKEFFQQKLSLEESEFKRTELEKLNKEKTSFFAVAAHELNGPAWNVKLFAEYLAFLISKKSSEQEINKQVSRIEHQSIKMNMLINDLRAASGGNQSMEYNLRDFDFDEIIREEVEEAKFSTPNKIEFSGETHAHVHSDPDRLGQVMTNLIRNAKKYSPHGEEIKVHISLQKNLVVVSIHDSGPGIGSSDLPHIFERFYKPASVSPEYLGLGLGLYVSKTIIDALGGKIWVTSELGKGSIFYFSLPVIP